MKATVLLVLVAVASAELDPLSDEFLELLQSKQTTWKAGRNFPKDTPKEFLRSLAGVTHSSNGVDLPLKSIRFLEEFKPPVSFDARRRWPECPIIGEIRDQGSCASDWAIAAATVMTDRNCIHSGGHDKTRYSTENLLACCPACGNGCEGGHSDTAFFYWEISGVVSGGRFNSGEGCQPYSIAECEHHVVGPRPKCKNVVPTPKCQNTCQSGYGISYTDDLQYGKSAYEIDFDVATIQYEILTNGPVASMFTLYEDFLSYKSGVYQNAEGREMGVHSVRIIGWGEENDTPYWLVANSWNTDWGDKGYFKIIRGTNECRIEVHVSAGLPGPF